MIPMYKDINQLGTWLTVIRYPVSYTHLFGVKLYNQTVNNPTDRSVPARIKKVVTDDALNEFYRLRNLYIPIQWIYKNDETATGTEKGQWFKMSQIQMRINGKDIVIKPNATRCV